MEILYRVRVPYSEDMIEVYGEPDWAAYEWRIVNPAGLTIRDTKSDGYGSAEIALRDALIASA